MDMFHTLFCLFIKPDLHKGQKVIGPFSSENLDHS